MKCHISLLISKVKLCTLATFSLLDYAKSLMDICCGMASQISFIWPSLLMLAVVELIQIG